MEFKSDNSPSIQADYFSFLGTMSEAFYLYPSSHLIQSPHLLFFTIHPFKLQTRQEY